MNKNYFLRWNNLFILFVLLGMTFPGMAQTPGLTSSPFQAGWFTIVEYTPTLSDPYIQLSFPHYDDTGSDRYIKEAHLQYSTDGSNYINLIKFNGGSQSRESWYWLKMTKMVSYNMQTYLTRSKKNVWQDISTSQKSYDYDKPSHQKSKDEATYADIRWYYKNELGILNNKAVKFRIVGTLGQDDNSNTASFTWNLFGQDRPIVIGNPLHEAAVTSFELQSDGTLKLNFNIPGYTAHSDEGSSNKGCYFIESQTYNSYYSLNYHYSNRPADFINKPASSGTFIYKNKLSREIYEKGDVISVASWRDDYYKQNTVTSISGIYKKGTDYTIPAYPQPTDLSISNEGYGKIKLSWKMNTPINSVKTDGFKIRWCVNNVNIWTELSQTVSYNKSTSEYSVTLDYPEQNSGTKTYWYQVKRAAMDWDAKLDDNTNLNPWKSINLNTNYMELITISPKATTGGADINWTVTPGMTGQYWYYKLYAIKVENSNERQIGNEISIDVKSVTDNNIETCVPTRYRIELYKRDQSSGGSNLISSVTSQTPIISTAAAKGKIEELKVSKGYYNDRVIISWKISNDANYNYYTITRKEKNNNNANEFEIYQVAPSGIKIFTYEDRNAIPGIYYDYTVTGWTTCDTEYSASVAATSTGFSQPYGVVSGRIAYEGSNAVNGVTVIAEGESAYANKSIELRKGQSTYVESPYKEGLLNPYEFSFQAWIKKNKSGISYIMSAHGKYNLWIQNNGTILIDIFQNGEHSFKRIPSATPLITTGIYQHLSVTYKADPIKELIQVKWYIDGKLACENEINKSSPYYPENGIGFDPRTTGYYEKIYIGSQGDSYFFDGYMDEVRFWSRELSEEEIKNNYDRFISGKENGLELYYRFDEIEGDEVFDLSCKNGVFNGRDGIIYGGNNSRRSTTEIPSAEQLAIKAVTDANGHYLLNTIPYTGTGTLYTITPMLGVHKFNPSNKPLYFSNASSTHNNVDFTDVSSFKVRGRVVYEGGNYPVEGAQFKIDDRIVVTPSGMPVTTDYEGGFTISVPIGIHEVKVEKSGHVFANDGKLINEETGENLNYNAEISGITFYDQTRIKLIGHIVGGKREHNKTAAFGYRINNIGADELLLTANKKDYNLSGNGIEPVKVDTVFLHNTGEWTQSEALQQDTTRMTVNGNAITIHVSPETGEYVAWVYPELYEIGDIKMNGSDIIYNRRELLDLRDATITDSMALKTYVRNWNDSIYVPASGTQLAYWKKIEIADTVRFHYEWGYYYQATPSYTIQQVNIDDNNKVLNYFGDKDLIIDKETTVPFVIENNGIIEYNFNDRPVFTQGTRYRFFLKAFEEYRNTKKSTGPFIDIMPVEEGTVSITADMALSNDNQVVVLDSIGEGYFDMIGGEPDLTTGERYLSTTINIDGIGYFPVNLGENGTLSTYLLGGKSTGTDFMTAASDIVDIVLHDPPGSESYAYIEQGSTVVETTTLEISDGLYQEADINVLLGVDQFVLAGVGLLTGGETEVIHKVGVHDEVEKQWFDNKTYTTTTTFTDRFETSSSDSYVGHAGDVFIGTGTNVLYGLMNSITVKKKEEFDEKDTLFISKDGNYALGKTVNFAVGATFSTRYYYAENEIEQIMIPKWESAKRNILLPSLGDIDKDTLTTPVYVSKFPSTHEDYAKPNTDSDFNGAKIDINTTEDYIEGPSYSIYFPKGFLMQCAGGLDASNPEIYGTLQFTDTVEYYTQKIKDWENLLAENEKNKVLAFNSKADGNISFGGGVVIEKSNTVTKDTVITRGQTISFKLLAQGETGFNILGGGLEVQNKTGGGSEETNSSETTNSEEISVGFVLQENSSLDEITVDYGRDPVHGTYVFRTRGGRTSCPYEGEVLTKYYEPGKHILSEATMQIEVPKITIDNGVYRVQVPAARAANFNLVLTNESESGDDGMFRLVVDEASNPDGAILKIDGVPIGNGRSLMVPYGKPLVKTLTVEKGPNADNYEEIRVLLVSECQFDLTDLSEDLFDYVDISIMFTPSCSEVAVISPKDNWIINTATSDTMQIEIGNFDINYSNFDHIELQYRPRSSPDWKTIHSFYADVKRYEAAQTTFKSMITTATIKYEWDMSIVYDGQYELRAYSACTTTGGELISDCYSDIITGWKDMSRPMALGYPSPANGILNAGGEISILFNEDIQSGALIKDNFSITGILNADQAEEPNVGISFNGTGAAFTELPIYTSGSFCIEAWFNRNANSAGTLFAYGEKDNNISLSFNEAGYAIVKIGNESYTSDYKIDNSETWKYISLSYNRINSIISVYVLQGSDPVIKLFEDKKFTAIPSTHGKLYVGNTISPGNGFHGTVGLMSFYSTIRSYAEALASMYAVKSGTEPDLIGHWEMNEGEGIVANDKARSRHLTLNTNWYIYPGGRSLSFDGIKQYAKIPSGTFPFRSFDNFTIEFWFRGADQQQATMLSCGEALYIGFDAGKKLILTASSGKHILCTENLLDGQWHHIALAVKRTGSANVIVDGKTTATINSNIFSGIIGGSYYYLGTKYINENTTEYFNGNIDEVRIWNAALTTGFVTLNKNNKLRGTESGLLAYYPFEKYNRQNNGLVLVSSNLDDMTNSGSSVENMSVTDNTGAPLQDCRPVREVPFDFTASNNKIVLNPTEQDYKLEGVILSISAAGIKDMRDNTSNTISWTAYVNRNPLRWNTDPVDLIVGWGDSESFTATITNNAGEYTDFVIENLPEWLEVDLAQGTLNPLESKDLKFTTVQGTNIGYYETAISLTGKNGMKSLLPVTLRVVSEKPDWIVNSGDFSSNMSFIGQIEIEGLPQEDEDDILSAFIGDVCVGITNPKYVKSYNTYYVFMDLYGNEEHDSLKINFKLWDASSGRIYTKIVTSQQGQNQDILFSTEETKYTNMASPIVLDAQNVIEQQITLYAGWNWISVNIKNNNPDLLSQYKNQLNDNCIEIKSKAKVYLEPNIHEDTLRWIGDLAEIAVEQTYLTKVKKKQILRMEGEPVDVSNTEITLYPGWNWIGYLPQLSTSVKNALAGIDAKDGDQIKSQDGFCIYNEDNGWIGTLNYMQPGKGYMYYSGNGQQVEFNYPGVNSMQLRNAMDDEMLNAGNKWNVDHRRFANSMTITLVSFLDNVEMKSDMIEIGAFVGNECRGSIMLSQQSGLPYEYLGFLMVYGESGDIVNFKMYDHDSGKECEKSSETLNFRANDKYGNGVDPYPVRFWENLSSVYETWINDINIYPNPATDKVTLNGTIKGDIVSITDFTGRSLNTFEVTENDKIFSVKDMPAGIYLVDINRNGIRKSLKLVVY